MRREDHGRSIKSKSEDYEMHRECTASVRSVSFHLSTLNTLALKIDLDCLECLHGGRWISNFCGNECFGSLDLKGMLEQPCHVYAIVLDESEGRESRARKIARCQKFRK